MEKRELLYEGKAKKIYATDKPDFCLIEFKDEATAFDGLKKEILPGKGVLNAQISALLFTFLNKEGVPTHFVRTVGERELYVQRLTIVPLEVVMRNRVAGSLTQRLGLAEGMGLKQSILEFYYKSDKLHDPLVNEDHIFAFAWAPPEVVGKIEKLSRRVNEALKAFFAEAGLDLVDFKLEFGFNGKREVVLGDEISPDTCRLWDLKTGEKLDKDRFRRDLGNVTAAYAQVLDRLRAAYRLREGNSPGRRG